MSNKNVNHFGGSFIKPIMSNMNPNFIYWNGDRMEFISAGDNRIYITKVIYNDPATIVFWSDGSKTISKCHGTDTYSSETGLLICYLKKVVGAAEVTKTLQDWTPELDEENRNNKVIAIKDVRNKHRK